MQNWIDSSDIGTEPKTNNRILQELNWLDSETTIFQFFGNIGRVQGVENILHAIQKMEYAHLAKFILLVMAHMLLVLKSKYSLWDLKIFFIMDL